MRRQRGATLISLMIGLLISLFGVLAMLSLYRNVVRNAAVATQDANLDGQLAAGLLRAQVELQGAGFGIDDAGSSDLQLATTDLDDSDQALLWRLQDSSGYRCLGLLDRPLQDTQTSQTYRALTLISADSCSASASLATLTWEALADLVEFRGQSAAQVSFSIESTTCWPFGSSGEDSESRAQVRLTAPSSSQLAGASAEAISYRVCLPNIHL